MPSKEKTPEDRIADLDRQCQGQETAIEMWGKAMLHLQSRIDELEKWRFGPDFRNGGK